MGEDPHIIKIHVMLGLTMSRKKYLAVRSHDRAGLYQDQGLMDLDPDVSDALILSIVVL